MQRITFTQKLSRQRRFLSSLIPLFAVVLGLGASQKAMAQRTPGSSTATIVNAEVTVGASSSTAATGNYNAVPTSGGTVPVANGATGIFAGTNFGTLDASVAVLLLQGGTVQITEDAGEIYDDVFITYGIAVGTGNPTQQNSIRLTETGYTPGPAGTGTRIFTATGAARSILALVGTAGSGTAYRFDIFVNAYGIDANGDGVFAQQSSARRRASFTATGTPVITPTITPTAVFIAQNFPSSPANTTFDFGSNPSTRFPGNDIGSGRTYDVNSGQLLLNGGSVTTTENGPNNINSAFLYYRVLSPTQGSGYQAVALTQGAVTTTGGVTTRTFSLTNAQLNLIASAAVTVGNNSQYSLDVYFEASGRDTRDNSVFSVTSPTRNNPYTAFFNVSGTLTAQTIWVGGVDDNWFNPNNWSAGVPNATTNTLIRDLGFGSRVPYPSIYANASKVDANGVVLYTNNFGPAETRNFVMEGVTPSSKSQATLAVGRLSVHGDFINTYNSFIQRENTTIEFSGTTGNTQIISNGTFEQIEISGGGRKNITNTITVNSGINFTATGGVLFTDVSGSPSTFVILADRVVRTIGGVVTTIPAARITGENESSYLLGQVRTTRGAVAVGEVLDYSNLGLTMTFTGANSPGSVDIIRNTAESYSPVVATGTNGRFSIRRNYAVTPGNPQANTGGLTADLSFRYRDAETTGLGGSNTVTPGSGMIPEARLTYFVTTDFGNNFIPLGRDGAVDVTNNIVLKSGVRVFGVFTLGDQLNPLPVRLTAFDAKRAGNDALITWQTASEQNSKGYEVQVSTNGTEFRTLASVPSAAPNTTTTTNYSYIDTEKNKAGLRYYRLRQIDVDGKDAFFAPKSVSFDGKVTESSLAAYPNPFEGSEQLHLSVQSAAGKGNLLMTDMTGRTIRQESIDFTAGLNDLTVGNAANLKAGIYLMRVSLPSGETKTLKVVKK